ncbi:MAG: hypothetical protein PHE79_06865 [Eubacteriales bacterium]|nr:hypothetical protein [Eubacteriales bacterium]
MGGCFEKETNSIQIVWSGDSYYRCGDNHTYRTCSYMVHFTCSAIIGSCILNAELIKPSETSAASCLTDIGSDNYET